MLRTVLIAATALLMLSCLQACTRYEPYPTGTVLDIKDESSAILELQEVTVPPPTPETELITEYRVGPGDVLQINVPGLINSVVFEGTDRVQNGNGFRVGTGGKILLPLVGAVEVAGLTVEEIQGVLIKELKTYIKKPVVTVEIIEFKSQPVYLLGEFRESGVHFLDRPTSLLHGLSMGNGFKDKANLRGARLLRGERLLPVDIYQLLYNNDQRQNVQLRPGDTVYVPDSQEQQVYVFGAVSSPGPVPMVNGRLNLAQALSSASYGSYDQREPYDQEHVRIIRSLSPTHGQLMVVDFSRMMDGYAMPMPLMDGDIVFIPKTKVGNWNEAINQLLPTLQLISSTLQPFIQIKWLDDNY